MFIGDERMTGISGRYGKYNDYEVITNLSFQTSQNKTIKITQGTSHSICLQAFFMVVVANYYVKL